VKLEKFLDPRGVRSDLLDQFRKAQPAYEPPELPNFAFEDDTLFESHRAPIRWIRALLLPLLKLLFNPNPLIQALHIQSRLNTISAERNARQDAARRQMDQAVLRAGPQPRRRDDADGHRGQEPQDAGRVDFEPAGVQRAARARARKRGGLQDGGSGRSATVAARVAATAATPAAAPSAANRDTRRRSRPTSHRFRFRRPLRRRAPSCRGAGTADDRAGTAAGVRSGRARRRVRGSEAAGGGRRRGRRGGGAAAAVMGAAGTSVPGAAPDERASGDAVDQMDALDAMDDDGSPEAEEIHEAAVERVEATAEIVTRQAESHAAPAVEPRPVEPAGGEPARVNHEPAEAPRVESPAPHVEAAPAAHVAAPETGAGSAGDAGTARITIRSENRGRRSAIRTGGQRRRRAARAVHRRAPGPPRAGRGADNLRETDYVTWRNELEAGVEQVNGVQVRRFRVKHERDPLVFGKRSDRVFEQRHSLGDELDWLDAEGPTSPALRRLHRQACRRLRLLPVSSAIAITHAYYGARAAGGRAILVPTAERDETIGLSIFRPLFRSVRALMYNSPEEQAMIHAVSGNESVPRRCRRHRLGCAEQPAGGTVPAEVQHPWAVCDLRGPHRSEQRLQGAVSNSSRPISRIRPASSRWC